MMQQEIKTYKKLAFGSRMNKRRKELGYTCQKLAAEIGMRAQTMKDIMCENRNPQAVTILKIAGALRKFKKVGEDWEQQYWQKLYDSMSEFFTETP